MIAVYSNWESYETHKYKMKSYWLLKQVGHIVTTRLQSADICISQIENISPCCTVRSLIGRHHSISSWTYLHPRSVQKPTKQIDWKHQSIHLTVSHSVNCFLLCVLYYSGFCITWHVLNPPRHCVIGQRYEISCYAAFSPNVHRTTSFMHEPVKRSALVRASEAFATGYLALYDAASSALLFCHWVPSTVWRCFKCTSLSHCLFFWHKTSSVVFPLAFRLMKSRSLSTCGMRGHQVAPK
jgi:hypothetical protein